MITVLHHESKRYRNSPMYRTFLKNIHNPDIFRVFSLFSCFSCSPTWIFCCRGIPVLICILGQVSCVDICALIFSRRYRVQPPIFPTSMMTILVYTKLLIPNWGYSISVCLFLHIFLPNRVNDCLDYWYDWNHIRLVFEIKFLIQNSGYFYYVAHRLEIFVHLMRPYFYKTHYNTVPLLH